MILYHFSRNTFNRKTLYDTFSVEELAVEEKTKIYVTKHSRIKKEDIGVLRGFWGDEMYLTENNPEIYINAMIARFKRSVGVAEAKLAEAQRNLSKWSELAERIKNEN